VALQTCECPLVCRVSPTSRNQARLLCGLFAPLARCCCRCVALHAFVLLRPSRGHPRYPRYALTPPVPAFLWDTPPLPTARDHMSSCHTSPSDDGHSSDENLLPTPSPSERAFLEHADRRAAMSRIEQFVADAAAVGLRVQSMTIAPAPRPRPDREGPGPAVLFTKDTHSGHCVVTVESPPSAQEARAASCMMYRSNRLPPARRRRCHLRERCNMAAGDRSVAAVFTVVVAEALPPHVPVRRPSLRFPAAVEAALVLWETETATATRSSPEQDWSKVVGECLISRHASGWCLVLHAASDSA